MEWPFVFFVQIGRTGDIQKANRAFSDFIGVPKNRMIGQPMGRILNVHSVHDTLIGEVIEKKQPMRGYGFPSGPLSHVQLYAYPIFECDRVIAVKIFGMKPPGIVADVPTEDHLAAPSSIDHLKRFAGVAAHEVGNALGTVFATAQLLQTVAPGEQAVVRLSERIETATKHAIHIIDELKLFGTPVRRMTSVDINETLREVTEIMDAEATVARARFVLRLDDRLPPVSSDRGRLRQVFTNLVKNGLDAINELRDLKEEHSSKKKQSRSDRDLSRIIIRSGRKRDGTIEICFFNHGSPIAPELRERLFEPFFSTKPKGIGLGLAICREIIEAHGGRLDFRSSSRFGTFFRVSLPPYIASDDDSMGRSL